MKADTKVKIIPVVQVGNRRFSTAKAAANEYGGIRSMELWRKYRPRYGYHTELEHNKFWSLREKMARRVLPIFERALSA